MISHAFVLLSVAAWASAQQSLYGQCGGVNWTGATTCVAGATCAYQNDYYSQCVPSSSTASSTRASSTSTSTKASSTTSSKASSATSSSKTSSTSSKSSSTSTSSSKTSSSSTTSTSATSSASPTCKVGKTPALGWNSWNAYGGNINEAKVVAAANQFISLGLKDVGYKYINIDDTWSNITGRAANNTILPDYTKFPDGISGTASKVHALGLLFGIYGDAGTATCAGYPGSLGYENIDAATFSSWGVDYLKYDNCNVPSNWTDYWTYTDWGQSNSAIRYRQMGDALKAQSNPILFSLCNWGNANVWQWGATVGQSWRMSGDSSATWSYITSIINSNSAYLDYVNFCGHNDMDMMEIGNGDLTLQEQRSHFAMWVALKSPILLGTDLSLLTADELAIIKNTELLAFSQDTTVGAPAKPYGTATTTPPEYYAGTSAKGVHVFVMNTSSSSSTKTITFADVPGLGSGTWKIHDMWTGTDVGSFSTSWSTTLAAHDTGAWLITAA